MRLVILFFLVLLIVSCKNSQTAVIDDYQKFKNYIPSDSSYQYFPFDSIFLISNELEVDSSIKQLYSEILFHLKEPSLYNDNKEREMRCVRVLWMNARRTPMVIRISDIDNSKYLLRKEFDSTYNGKTGGIIDTLINIDENYWDTVSSSLDSSNFWKQKIGNPTASEKDGILWVLEYRLKGRYYFIERWDDGTLSSILPYSFLSRILRTANVLK
jgi:hypothetical protein